jgi:bifunctional non-homologous end joining protein LigD
MSEPAGSSGLPRKFEPQLATAADVAPDGEDWLHEIKYDGYRLLCRVEGGGVRLISRNGKDWSAKFPGIVRAIAALALEAALLDGEVAVVRSDGRTRFQDLQQALGGSLPAGAILRYFLFDAIHLNGTDLSTLALLERKARLSSLLSNGPETDALAYGDHVEGHGRAFHDQACRHGLEGTISKRKAAPYRQGRSRDWLKVKCLAIEDFVVGGFTEPGGSRHGFGALLVGGYDEAGTLRFAGRVGTGFRDAQLTAIGRTLSALEVEEPPFAEAPAGDGLHWVRPDLVARVAYAERTTEGLLRHPSFRGLVEDRTADSVRLPIGDPAVAPVVQAPAGAGRAGVAEGDVVVAGIVISNPDKVMYPGAAITKLEVARHYERVAEWMLPYVADRPLTLVRCPGGIDDCFYQKHLEGSIPEALGAVQTRDDRSPEGVYTYVDSAAGLVALAQLGVLEIHTWGASRDDLERPDRFTLDLDPDPGIPWIRVAEAALELRGFLGELGLVSFLKTTGGKGLHVVVPIEPGPGWAEVKEFSRLVAAAVAADWPGRYTLNISKAKRKGRILIDYLRNGREATAIEAWSTRARPGAPVAVPVRWEELADGVTPEAFNVRNAVDRLDRLDADPWEEYGVLRQPITPAMMQKLGME